MRNRLALGLAALPFALHLAALAHYDFFRDELYFIMCGRHPAFGYVDEPPLVPLLAAASQSAGESLWLLRIVPALFHVGAVLAACAVVRVLGGGGGAQLLAGLATGTAPLLLGVTASLSTTALEPLAWTLVAYAALCAILRNQPRWWIAAGIVAGLTLEDKYTIAFLLVALIAGVAAAGPRSTFARGAFWLGAGVTLVIAGPSLVWQALNGWPFMEVLRAGAQGKNVVMGPIPWLTDQVLIAGPLFAPLWITGLAMLIIRARERFLGVAVLLVFAAFIVLHAKNYYIAGIYPLLFAAGAAGLERAIRSERVRRTYAGLATAGTLVFAPLALPLLPEATLITYAAALDRALHIDATQSEHHGAGRLPQFFADMHGWRTLEDRVAVVERSLSPKDFSNAAVLTQNYGEAGALDVFGDHRLPVISGHNNYFLWGSQGTHDVLIIVGGEKRTHQRTFRDVRQVEIVRSSYAMPYESDLPIFLARDPKVDFDAIWRGTRHYD